MKNFSKFSTSWPWPQTPSRKGSENNDEVFLDASNSRGVSQEVGSSPAALHPDEVTATPSVQQLLKTFPEVPVLDPHMKKLAEWGLPHWLRQAQ